MWAGQWWVNELGDFEAVAGRESYIVRDLVVDSTT